MSRDLHRRVFDALYEHHTPSELKSQRMQDLLWNFFIAGRIQGRLRRNGRAPRFTMPEVVNICAAYYDKSRNLSVSDIARMYKCSPSVITRIIEGKYIPRIDP